MVPDADDDGAWWFQMHDDDGAWWLEMHDDDDDDDDDFIVYQSHQFMPKSSGWNHSGGPPTSNLTCEDFFGHDSFRPGQEAVLRSALNRQERLLENCLQNV